MMGFLTVRTHLPPTFPSPTSSIHHPSIHPANPYPPSTQPFYNNSSLFSVSTQFSPLPIGILTFQPVLRRLRQLLDNPTRPSSHITKRRNYRMGRHDRTLLDLDTIFDNHKLANHTSLPNLDIIPHHRSLHHTPFPYKYMVAKFDWVVT